MNMHYRYNCSPIFIVGMPRSGTTLLSAILNSHSQIAITPETHFCPKYLNTLSQASSQGRQTWEKAIYSFIMSYEISQFNFPHQVKEQLFEKFVHGKTTVPDIFSTLLQTFAKIHSKSIWGEKTPRHLEYVSLLKDWYPDANFVCVIRDPRDCSLSLSQVSWSKANIVSHALRWRNYASLSTRYQKYYCKNYYEVLYEDLIRFPSLTVSSLCHWLDIKFEPEMIHLYNKSALQLFNSNSEPWKTNTFNAIDAYNWGKWKQKMNYTDSTIFNVLCKKYMKMFNYEIFIPHNFIYILSKYLTIKSTGIIIIYFFLVKLKKVTNYFINS